jgi:hypothetical protein
MTFRPFRSIRQAAAGCTPQFVLGLYAYSRKVISVAHISIQRELVAQSQLRRAIVLYEQINTEVLPSGGKAIMHLIKTSSC